MKMMMADKELEKIHGGDVSPYMISHLKKINDAKKAEEAEQPVFSEPVIEPAGILGELADLEDLLNSLR